MVPRTIKTKIRMKYPKCPKCNSEEVDAMIPRTVYECGSSDYDQRPGTFIQSDKCVLKLAEQSWEGCDGCDETDKNFWMKGFQVGYNKAEPDEILDEEIEKVANSRDRIYMEEKAFIIGAKWYREQLKYKKN